MKDLRFVEIEEKGTTRILYLNAPPVNGLNLELVDELARVLSRLETAPPKVRCLVVTSRLEDVFIAGADIKMIKAYMEGPDLVRDMVRFNGRLQAVINQLEALPFPVIAAINGHALGGGLELALACDFRFMADGKGRVGLPEVNLGILPGAGGCQRLARLVGRSRAKDIIYQSRLLDPQTALSMGILDQIFSPDRLIEESLAYADQFRDRAWISISVVKACIDQGLDRPVQEGLALEMKGLERLLETEDLREGITAFLEKRRPRFRGR